MNRLVHCNPFNPFLKSVDSHCMPEIDAYWPSLAAMLCTFTPPDERSAQNFLDHLRDIGRLPGDPHAGRFERRYLLLCCALAA